MSKVEHNKKLFDIEQKADNKVNDNSGLDFKEIIKEDKPTEVKETKEAKTDIPKERIITYKFKGGRPKGAKNKKTLRKLKEIKEREEKEAREKSAKNNTQTNTPTVGLITQETEPKKSDNNSNSTTTKQ